MPTLKDVFKYGVSKFSKEELAELFARARNKLYRAQDPDVMAPKAWFDRGWVEPKSGSWGMPTEDPQGLYWAPTKKDLKTFMRVADPEGEPIGKLSEYSNIIEGLPRPGATMATVGKLSRGGQDIKTPEEFLPDTDFLKRSYPVSHEFDPEGYTEPFTEIAQRKPGNVLARYNDYYRILSILAALGLAKKEME